MRRRAPVAVALIGFALPMLLPVFYYASTARPYAMWLAFSGWSFASWQQAAEQQDHRFRALFVLFICLSGAVLTHYFGLAIFIPLVMAEAWRNRRESRFDRAVWLTIIAAATLVTAYLPFLPGASSYRFRPWQGVEFDDLTATYGSEIAPVLLILLAVSILIALARPSSVPSQASNQAIPLRFPQYERIAIGVLYSIPLLVFVAAKLVTHVYAPKYAVIFVISLVLLLSAAVQMLTSNIQGFTSLVALALLLAASRPAIALLKPDSAVPDEIDSTLIRPLEQSGVNVITTPNWDLGARLFVFAPPRLRPRLVLLSTGSRALLATGRVMHIPIETPEELVRRHREFLLIEDYGIQEILAKEGARITFLGRALGRDVDVVESPAAAGR